MTTPLTRLAVKRCCYASLAFFAALLLCSALWTPELLSPETGQEAEATSGDGQDYDIYGEFYR